MTETGAMSARADEYLAQWPTFTEVSGCMDCDRLFRSGHSCPLCGSESVLNLAALLTEKE